MNSLLLYAATKFKKYIDMTPYNINITAVGLLLRPLKHNTSKHTLATFFAMFAGSFVFVYYHVSSAQATVILHTAADSDLQTKGTN